MKIFRLAFLFLISMLNSCDKDDEGRFFTNIYAACGVQNPLEELPWLKTEINRMGNSTSDDIKYCYVVQAELNGETVFRLADCNPLVDKAIPILNCEGNELTPNMQEIVFENERIVWRPSNFACNLK